MKWGIEVMALKVFSERFLSPFFSGSPFAVDEQGAHPSPQNLPRKHPSGYYAKYSRKYYLKHHSQMLEKNRKYYQKNKKRILEQRKQSVNQKIDAIQHLTRYHTELQDCCEECGSIHSLERHHPDYSKPLNVVTLCRSCHLRIHRGSGNK